MGGMKEGGRGCGGCTGRQAAQKARNSSTPRPAADAGCPDFCYGRHARCASSASARMPPNPPKPAGAGSVCESRAVETIHAGHGVGAGLYAAKCAQYQGSIAVELIGRCREGSGLFRVRDAHLTWLNRNRRAGRSCAGSSRALRLGSWWRRCTAKGRQSAPRCEWLTAG